MVPSRLHLDFQLTIGVQLGTEVQRLNLIYCELTGLLALAQGSMATSSAPRSRGSAKRKLQQGQTLAVSAQMERIATFVVDLLDTASAAPMSLRGSVS